MSENGVDSWPQLVEYAMEKCSSEDPTCREIGLFILKPIVRKVNQSIFDQSSDINMTALLNICQTCLLDNSNNGKVAISALSAVASIISVFETDGSEKFNAVVITMFRAFNNLFLIYLHDNQAISEAKLCLFLEILIEIAEDKPMLFVSQLNALFEPIVALLNKTDNDAENAPQSVKLLLLEFLVELCESSPKVVRKIKGNRGEVY